MRTNLLAFVSVAMLLIGFSTAAAQAQEVRGTVVDQNGEAILGATVMVEGTSRGTTSGVDGSFTIQAASNATLEVSFIGYTTQSVPVSGRSSIRIELAEESTTLDQVVVVGYGTVRARNFTGSVDVINMEDSPIALMAATDPTELLRGTVSGLVMTQTGQAGESGSITLRGQRSVNRTTTEPLLVVDGMIYSGQLNDIDPTTIESISVLKDATSLAAYGSRASNGAIMITTKRGKSGKPMISLSATNSFARPTKTPDFRSPEGYIQLMADRNGQPAGSTAWMSDVERLNYDAGKSVDWYDMVTQTGYTQNYNLNISGATDRANYFMSAGRSMQKGIVRGNDFNRTNFSMRLSTHINEYIEVGANMSYTFSNTEGVMANIQYVQTSPWGSATLPDGRMRKYPEQKENQALNPLWDTYNGVDRQNHRKNNTYGGFVNIKIPWVDGLSFRVNGSYSTVDLDYRNFVHEYNLVDIVQNDIDGSLGYGAAAADAKLSSANGYIQQTKTTNWVIDNILSYTQEFGKHYVSASLVYTRDSAERDQYRLTGTGFTDLGNTALGWYGLSSADTHTISNLSYRLHNDVGYLGRVIYSYDDTYHFNASLRRDGSSVFGKDNKWGNFPAVGGAWTISNEKFMQNVNFIDNLKVKLTRLWSCSTTFWDGSHNLLQAAYLFSFKTLRHNEEKTITHRLPDGRFPASFLPDQAAGGKSGHDKPSPFQG